MSAWRRVMWVFLPAYLALLHGVTTMNYVISVPPHQFGDHAVELEATPDQRYGYVVTWWTPPVLVRTENTRATETGPATAREVDPALHAAMGRRLAAFPRRAVGEGAVYVLFVLYVGWAVPWLRRRLAPTGAHWGRRLFAGVLVWQLGWSLLLAPLTLFGHGVASLGVGGVHAHSLASETVSYGVVLRAVALAFLVLAHVTGLGALVGDPPTPQALWWGGLFFTGLLGGLDAAVTLVGERRARQGHAV